MFQLLLSRFFSFGRLIQDFVLCGIRLHVLSVFWPPLLQFLVSPTFLSLARTASV